MKLRKLEEELQQLDGFEQPKVHLEQYITSAHVAACMLHTAEESFGDLDGKVVADLGTGCGTLAIGAVLQGARVCFGFEIDPDAIRIAKQNVLDAEVGVEIIQDDVEAGLGFRWEKCVDTVLMNPPFGTKKNKGADLTFLQEGLRMAKSAVYSLHKTSTRQHVLGKAKSWGVRAQVVAELRYDLPATYRFHKKQSVDIEVDFIRFSFES
jgi:rRNA N6-adenosine-methyltransferase METTL5